MLMLDILLEQRALDGVALAARQAEEDESGLLSLLGRNDAEEKRSFD